MKITYIKLPQVDGRPFWVQPKKIAGFSQLGEDNSVTHISISGCAWGDWSLDGGSITSDVEIDCPADEFPELLRTAERVTIAFDEEE